MNFRKIAGVAKELCLERLGSTLLFDWGIREFKKGVYSWLDRSDWENIEIEPTDVSRFYSFFREKLQLIGMSLTTGDQTHDEALWDELTKALEVFREVLVSNFHVELPTARVVSMVTDMVECEFLEGFTGKDGQLYVKPKEKPYDLKIKIVKIPAGPAPEEIRQKWVGLILPAYIFPRNQKQRDLYFGEIPVGYEECYAVPKIEAIELLKEVFLEAAEWFINNMSSWGDFWFQLSEAEIVQ